MVIVLNITLCSIQKKVVFKPKKYKLNCPRVSLTETVIPNLNSVKYLGVILTDNLQDDEEIMKQTRSLSAHGNVLLNKFGLCSSEKATIIPILLC